MEHKSDVEHRAEKEYKHKKHGFNFLLREVLSNALHSCLISEDCESPHIILNATHDENRTQILVSDNGEGFTKENYDCFDVLDSVNIRKERRRFSPKGQGRLAIVYYTDHCEYNSTFRDQDGSVWQRIFDYPKRDVAGLFDAHESCPSENETIQTRVQMSCISQQKQLRAKTFFSGYDSAEKLKGWILSNFMPFFLPDDEENIGSRNIVLDISLNGDNAKISRNDLVHDVKRLKFSLSLDGLEHSFQLWLLQDSTEAGKKIPLISCARGLVVSVKPRLEYEFAPKEGYKVFMASGYFDDRVSSTGDTLDLEPDVYEAIKKQVYDKLDTIFSAEIEENRRQTKRNFQEFEEKLPPFSQFLEPEELAVSSRMVLPEKEIVSKACCKKTEEELKFFRGEETAYRDQVMRSGLAVYVKHRKAVLEEFGRMLELYQSGSALEKELHQIICPSGDYNGEEDYFKHNLWLVDDKFAYFSRTHSAGNGEAASDIIIRAYADNNPEPAEIVFIELKRPFGAHNAGDKNEDMTEQVVRYAKNFFKAGKGLGANGGAIDIDTSKCRFFGYILAGRDDIEKERERRYEKDTRDVYTKIPFSSFSFYRDVGIGGLDKPEKMMRVEMYAYSDLKKLCENRNRVFFNLLDKPIRR